MSAMKGAREILDAALAGGAGRTCAVFEHGARARRVWGGSFDRDASSCWRLAGRGANVPGRREVLGEALTRSMCDQGGNEEPRAFRDRRRIPPGARREERRAAEGLRGSGWAGGCDLLLILVSGGASALLADAAPGITLEDLKQLTGALLRSGAAIGEINTVRKHVSTLKGGNLVRRAAPARVVTLLLSDVVGDEPSSIGSGLTAPDPTKLEDARRVLQRYEIKAPQSVTDHLEKDHETPSLATLPSRSSRTSLSAADG